MGGGSGRNRERARVLQSAWIGTPPPPPRLNKPAEPKKEDDRASEGEGGKPVEVAVEARRNMATGLVEVSRSRG